MGPYGSEGSAHGLAAITKDDQRTTGILPQGFPVVTCGHKPLWGENGLRSSPYTPLATFH
jgi:hypothetical protein